MLEAASSPPWDESTRPTRVPTAIGSVTDRGRAQARHLVEIHDYLRAELTRVRELVARVRGGTIGVDRARAAINDLTMRQHGWSFEAYCAAYCRLVTQHHTIEDRALFPHLRDRDADLGPVLDRLTEEHEAIHYVLEELDRALVASLDDPAGLDRLDAAVGRLSSALLSHLAYEERELLDPIARHELLA